MTAASEDQSDRAVSHDAVATEIFRLLETRPATASICPSEVARSLGTETSWRGLMDAVRTVAARLAAEGRVRITQGDATVDPASVSGPVRIRRIVGS